VRIVPYYFVSPDLGEMSKRRRGINILQFHHQP